MANSKRRCKSCEEYFIATEVVKTGIGVFCVTCLPNARKVIERKRKARAANNAQKPRKGPNSAIRASVRRRDGERCRWCGKTRSFLPLEVHHITYRSQGGPDWVSNLITLCDEHHAEAHSDKGKWQPVLRAVIWCHYVEGMYYFVPEMVRELERRFPQTIDA